MQITHEGPRVTIYIRTSKELHEWLAKVAKDNNRSVNNMAETILLQAKRASERPQPPPPAKPPKKRR